MPTRRFALTAVLVSMVLPPASVVAQPDGDTPAWRNDEPGRVYSIDVSSLPAPSESHANFPSLAERQSDADLEVPPGFDVSVFTQALEAPRKMRVAPNGDIFVAETEPGRIKVLHATADGSGVESIDTYAESLDQPFGMQFYPAGDDPEWLYVAENNRVIRYSYDTGDTQASSEPEVVVPELAPTSGGHYTRDLAFSPDGQRMFVSVGSASNVAGDMSTKSPEEIEAWEAEHGLGAAWGNETNRAAVLVYEVGADDPGEIYATGLRNCVALTVQPATGDLWCTVNERDALGDHLVPDYSTRVQEGGFYGWPWYYMGDNEDPRHEGARPDLAGDTIDPDVPYRSHSAATGFAFYTATSGDSAFPSEYVGDAFAVFHGSWNREDRTGHKVVRVPIEDGEPTGEYIDFLVGFINEEGQAWARPSSVTQLPDGSLLVSEDGNNVVYRIAYEGNGR